MNLYIDLKEPKFGYYLNSNLQITSIDLKNHNIVYEYFCIGKYKKEEVIKIIEFIREYDRNNGSNKYLYVKILFNHEEYDVTLEEEYNKLREGVSTGKENYFLNVNYNDESGFINSITINEI